MSLAKPKPCARADEPFFSELARRDPRKRRDFGIGTTVSVDVPGYDPDPYYATISKRFGASFAKEQRRLLRQRRKDAKAAAEMLAAIQQPVRPSAQIHAFIPPEGLAVPPWSDDVPFPDDDDVPLFAHG